MGFVVTYGNNPDKHIYGSLPTEVTVSRNELQAIKAALSHIKTPNVQRWTIFSYSPALVQALTRKVNPDYHDLVADPKQGKFPVISE